MYLTNLITWLFMHVNNMICAGLVYLKVIWLMHDNMANVWQ